MDKRIFEYLNTQRVGALAIQKDDNSPHAATVHFAHTEDPFILYFETHSESIKGKSILKNDKSAASFVVGSDESNMKTLQLDGIIQLVKAEETKNFSEVYVGKFPEKSEKIKDPKVLYLKFTPNWWRFTDWTQSQGKLILTSET